ncbi:hypothetical protein THASP1DRAFT_24488 [Thamnocephalis sphaerospora]|uniref:Uncharacterized protein n=1 Tax=Thamnocephalis sphaerospora TaxID=78915 RepID=A0A4V1IWF2_9FUNG|nr:hypothetical protein THASP1DRAFT_24488 [Thamnocephalis sphaerospora]|eukprot:RKP07349.1 hypothetical protein THASP1DRAFT_24488 [Thamnocephalis sphaerospora]
MHLLWLVVLVWAIAVAVPVAAFEEEEEAGALGITESKLLHDTSIVCSPGNVICLDARNTTQHKSVADLHIWYEQKYGSCRCVRRALWAWEMTGTECECYAEFRTP